MCLLKPFAWLVVVCWDFLVRSCVFLTLTLKQEEDERLFQQHPRVLFDTCCLAAVVCCDFLVRSCVFLAVLEQEEGGDCPSNIPMCLLKPVATFCLAIVALCAAVFQGLLLQNKPLREDIKPIKKQECVCFRCFQNPFVLLFLKQKQKMTK